MQYFKLIHFCRPEPILIRTPGVNFANFLHAAFVQKCKTLLFCTYILEIFFLDGNCSEKLHLGRLVKFITEVEVIPEKKTKKKRNRCKLKKKKKCRKKDLIDAECVCAPLNPIVSKFNIGLWFLMTARVLISGSQFFAI